MKKYEKKGFLFFEKELTTFKKLSILSVSCSFSSKKIKQIDTNKSGCQSSRKKIDNGMANRPFLYFFSCIFFLVSLLEACTPKEQTPPNILSSKEMAEILTEIHLIEARITQLNLGSTDSTAAAYRYLEKKYLDSIKIDTASYHKSFRYYAQYPEKMKPIYDEVAKKLDLLKKKTPQGKPM